MSIETTDSPEVLLRAASRDEDAGRENPPRPRPAIIPLRWRGHRVDVCALIRDHQVTFIARDVLEAIGHEAGIFDADPAHAGDGWSQAAHATATSWDRTAIGNILEAIAETPRVAAFLTWLDEQIHWIVVDWGIDTVEQFMAAPHPKVSALGLEAPAAAPEPRWYSVSEAAAILSRDPAIRIGRTGLFEWLHSRGWVAKSADVWRPAKDLLTFGHLVVLDNKLPGRRDLYPQICITPVGLEALHRHLGGVADLNLTPSDTPLLEEQ